MTAERALELSGRLGLGWSRSQVAEISGHPQFGELVAKLEADVARKAAEDKAKADALVAAARHMRQHGPISNYVCWSCRTKFKAAEKDPHICPGCGTDLDAE